MFAGLKLEPVWSGNDIVEIVLTASNGQFSGRANIYIFHGELSDAADTLTGFPNSISDKCTLEFGEFGPELAKGAARITLHCLD
jgi:hypothetical protein